MQFSPIDALMQVATKPRVADPQRAEGPGAFAPALAQAYQPEAPPKPAPPAASKPSTEEPKKSHDPKAAGGDGNSDRSRDDADVAASGDAAANGADAVEEETVAKNDADAVEISAESAAAVAAAANGVAANQETTVTTVSGTEEDGAVQGAAEKSKEEANQELKDRSATEEVAADATLPEGEAAEGDSTGVRPSQLNSTRTGSAEQALPSSRAERPQAKTENGTPDGSSDQAVAAPTLAEETPSIGAESEEQVGVKRATKGAAGASKQEAAPKDAASKRDAQAANGATLSAGADESGAAPPLPTAARDAAADAANLTAPTPAPETAASSQPASRTAGAIDRLLAGHSLKGAQETDEPNGMPTVDRARFVQRVEGAMKAAQQRDGKIQVRLSPPDLGSVKIELAVQNGVLSAKLEAETPAARNLLLDSLPVLRERLALQDIRVDKFDVDVRRESGGFTGGQADDPAANQSGDRQNGRSRGAVNRTVSTTAAAAARVPSAASTAAGLDIRI